MGPRDRFIGWTIPQRQAGLHRIANQQRFLILPWVRVPQLASHLLRLASQRVSVDWRQRYGHPLALLEGGLDFTRTITTAVMCGTDTDCNSATAGSIVGAAIGYDALPQRWILAPGHRPHRSWPTAPSPWQSRAPAER